MAAQKKIKFEPVPIAPRRMVSFPDKCCPRLNKLQRCKVSNLQPHHNAFSFPSEKRAYIRKTIRQFSLKWVPKRNEIIGKAESETPKKGKKDEIVQVDYLLKLSESLIVPHPLHHFLTVKNSAKKIHSGSLSPIIEEMAEGDTGRGIPGIKVLKHFYLSDNHFSTEEDEDEEWYDAPLMPNLAINADPGEQTAHNKGLWTVKQTESQRNLFHPVKIEAVRAELHFPQKISPEPQEENQEVCLNDKLSDQPLSKQGGVGCRKASQSMNENENTKISKLKSTAKMKEKRPSTPITIELSKSKVPSDVVPVPTSIHFSLKENERSFIVLGAGHPAVGIYLRKIGWIEKHYNSHQQAQIKKLLLRSGKVQKEEPAKLIWTTEWINCNNLSERVVTNRIPCDWPFTKVNLSIGIKKSLPFIYKKNSIFVETPRTFEILSEDDMKDFLKEYRLSACLCLLKKFHNTPKSELISNKGTVNLSYLEFALKRVSEFLRIVRHEDLDETDSEKVYENEWKSFLFYFHEVTNSGAKFHEGRNTDLRKLHISCNNLIKQMLKYYPELTHEGTRNLWIMKPSNNSCGRGIKVLQKYSDLTQYYKPGNIYVIQKYIEDPLLIYRVKFDIRQWFVITSVNPLVIWMYDECYLRFCSKEFTLNDFHESVHLCNNAVQKKYFNFMRTSRIPEEKMWDCNQFSNFLRWRYREEAWPRVQRGMKEALTAACLASQGRMSQRENSFQLYGADFMVTPDLRVWLIEINTIPALNYSTTVTARMAKAVLEDTIKVGLLRKLNPSTKVGKFVEIYRQGKEGPKELDISLDEVILTRPSTILPSPLLKENNKMKRKTKKEVRIRLTEDAAMLKEPSIEGIKESIDESILEEPSKVNKSNALQSLEVVEVVNTTNWNNGADCINVNPEPSAIAITAVSNNGLSKELYSCPLQHLNNSRERSFEVLLSPITKVKYVELSNQIIAIRNIGNEVSIVTNPYQREFYNDNFEENVIRKLHKQGDSESYGIEYYSTTQHSFSNTCYYSKVIFTEKSS